MEKNEGKERGFTNWDALAEQEVRQRAPRELLVLVRYVLEEPVLVLHLKRASASEKALFSRVLDRTTVKRDGLESPKKGHDSERREY
jgi:hypothetical protein